MIDIIVFTFFLWFFYRVHKNTLKRMNERQRLEFINSINSGIKNEVIKGVPNSKKEFVALHVKEIMMLKHEIHSDIHYFYSILDDTFICQGSTLPEAAKHYIFRKGNESLGVFAYAENNNKSYCFVDGECEDFVDV